MNLGQVITEVNNLSDEQELPEIVLGFVNDCLARINIECDANFPFQDLQNQTEDMPLPEKWVRVLVIPFGVGRVKQRDSSQFEYSDAYNEFRENLNEFKMKYTIPEEYKEEVDNTEGYESDIYEKPPYPFWSW